MVVFDFPITPRRTREEDVYEDLCYVTLRVTEVVHCLKQAALAPTVAFSAVSWKGPAFFGSSCAQQRIPCCAAAVLPSPGLMTHHLIFDACAGPLELWFSSRAQSGLPQCLRVALFNDIGGVCSEVSV